MATVRKSPPVGTAKRRPIPGARESAPSSPLTARERRDQVLEAYRKAFAGFNDDELSILDGVVLEPVQRDRRR